MFLRLENVAHIRCQCLSFAKTLMNNSTNIYGLFDCAAYDVTQKSMSKRVIVYHDDYKLVSCNQVKDKTLVVKSMNCIFIHVIFRNNSKIYIVIFAFKVNLVNLQIK